LLIDLSCMPHCDSHALRNQLDCWCV
jgi:hypothetical protein